MSPLESCIWLLVGTQGLSWLTIFSYEAWEKNVQRDAMIRVFKQPYCRVLTEKWTGRRFYTIRGCSTPEAIEALLASSTFAQLTQEEQER